MMRLILSLVLSLTTSVILSQNPNEIKALKKNQLDTLRLEIERQYFQKQYDEVILLGEEVLKDCEELGYYKPYFPVASFLASTYVVIEDTLQSTKTYKRSIQKALEIDDDTSLIMAKIDAANYYALQQADRAKTRALKLYEETIPLAEKVKDTNSLLILHLNRTELLIDKGNISEAQKSLQIATTYMNEETFSGYLGSKYLDQGIIFLKEGKPELALKEFERSEPIFRNLQHNDGIIDIYEQKVQSYLALKQFENAYNNMAILDSLKETRYERDKIDVKETVSARFKLASVEEQLAEQELLSELKAREAKRETSLFWAKIGLGALAIFFIILFFSFIKRKRLVKELIHKNKQYLREKDKSEKLSKAKSILFSNVTHELRTPLYGIIGIAKVLLEDPVLKKHAKNIKSLNFSADYLLALINNVLYFNKSESQKQHPTFSSEKSIFKVSEIVFAAVEASQYLCENHPNKFTIDIASDTPSLVRGHRMHLAQILVNIIGNAAKFTKDGKIHIAINSKKQPNKKAELTFKITDDGVGIPSEKMDTIFDEYAQTGEGEDFMGAGLGLPIVKSLLQDQGSSIHLISKEGHGTEAEFTLEYEVIAQSVDTDDEEHQDLSGKRILIVDDNKINLLVTEKTIERLGGQPFKIDNGLDAIHFVQNNDIDLILMDINMPKMNGFQTTEKIRTFNKDIPIIALTAVEEEKVIEKEHFQLMNDIVVKPYQEKEFYRILCAHLDFTESIKQIK